MGEIVEGCSDLDGEVTQIDLNIPLFRKAFADHDKMDHTAVVEWLEGKYTKVCLQVDSEEELTQLIAQAREAKLPCSLIVDSGLTEFHGVPTITCGAIGPAYPDQIDRITSHLKLY